MCQTHIFNFFPGSIHSSRILRTSKLFTSRQKHSYIPNQQIWLNRLYFQISNSKEKKCLTIDTGKLAPGKFRTSDGNGEEQTCYFNRNKRNTHFSSFVAKLMLNLPTITFYIVKVKSDFDLVNKSLEIKLNSSLTDGESKRQLQQTGRKNISNGRSETETRTDTSKQRQRGGKYNDSREIAGTFRKKPRFLSD